MDKTVYSFSVMSRKWPSVTVCVFFFTESLACIAIPLPPELNEALFDSLASVRDADQGQGRVVVRRTRWWRWARCRPRSPSSSPMAAVASWEGPVRLRPALHLLPYCLVRNPPAEITDTD
jgi:hypothetical protein